LLKGGKNIARHGQKKTTGSRQWKGRSGGIAKSPTFSEEDKETFTGREEPIYYEARDNPKGRGEERGEFMLKGDFSKSEPIT